MARIFIGVLLSLAPHLAWAQGPRNADDAVRSALALLEIAAEAERQIAVTSAALADATQMPTPSLSLGRAQVFGDINVGVTEYTAAIEQRVDPSGWRDDLRKALPHRVAAIEHEAEIRRLDTAAAVRAAFFAVRHREARIAALQPWAEQLRASHDALLARLRRGDVSALQTLRIKREIHRVTARSAGEVSALAEARAGLAAWTGWDDAATALDGTLRPETTTAEGPSALAEVELLSQLEAAVEREIETWGAPFGRDWLVGAGYRHVEVGPSTGQGFLVTLALPIPLWNTDESRLQGLRAHHAHLRSAKSVRQASLSRGLAAAHARLRQTLTALDTLTEPAQDAELSQLARRAFDAGESPLSELLDVFESQAELQLSRIDLQWEARRAAIDLDRRLGKGVPQ